MSESRNRIPWFRIGAESAAIVASILLAFGIDAWYDAHVARQRADEYQHRIAIELRNARVIVEGIARLVERASEYAVEVSRWYNSPENFVDHDRLVVALYNAGRDNIGTLDTSGYQDLVSTGNLGLLSNVDQRQAIQQAYAYIELISSSHEPNRDEYLLAVRGWIPQDLIDDIQATCANMASEDWLCPPINFDDEVVQEILQRVSTDEAYLALQLRRQGLDVLRRQLTLTFENVDAALGLLE